MPAIGPAADARYAPTGHLVFLRRGLMFAVPFDAGQLKVEGQPVPVLDGVAQALNSGNTNNITGAGQFTIAASGSLAWVPGAVARGLDSALVTVDRQGRASVLPSPARFYGPSVRVSPDGRKMALTISDLTEVGVWLYDLGRGVLTSLHRRGEASWPVWSPDGQHVSLPMAQRRAIFPCVAARRRERVAGGSPGAFGFRSVLVGAWRPSARNGAK